MSFEQAVVQLEQTNAALQEEVIRFRDAAMGLNAIYPTITEGRQAVADGKYFSVPGGGAYMRLYRRQGSSAALIAEFPDRAQVQSLVDTLGGRGVVGGSGDLLANGAYGLGKSGYTLTNFDALPDKNEFFQGQGGSATGDIPPNANYYPGLDLARISGSVTRPVRLMFSGYTCYVRAWDSDNVPSTARMFHNRNILGTASQSDGIPTGAIIERGSNANGEYVKFADGTLICTRILNIEVPSSAQTGPLHFSAIGDFDFPSLEFVSGLANFVSGVVLGSQSSTIRGSSFGIRFRRGSSVLSRNDWIGTSLILANSLTSTPGELTTISLFAFGRWY